MTELTQIEREEIIQRETTPTKERLQIEAMREDLRALYDSLTGYEWLHPEWREVRRLARELNQQLYIAEKHPRGHMPPDVIVGLKSATLTGQTC